MKNKIAVLSVRNRRGLDKQHPSAGGFFSIFSASAVTLLIFIAGMMRKQVAYFEGRVARARRYGARALILGRNLRKPSKKATLLAPVLLGTIISMSVGLFGFGNVNNTYAADSITLSISNSTLAINLFPDNTTGTFSKSSAANISVSTTSSSGYTLSIVGSNDTRNLVGSDTATGNNLSSITTSTTEATFSSNNQSDYTTYNNKWGYMPSEYVNYVNDEPVRVTNTGANAVFLPGPTTAGDILRVTDCANGAAGCSSGADTVSIAIGARANSSLAKGTYSNTFVIQAVTNTSVVECDDTKFCVQYDGNGLTFPATESQSERVVNNVNYDSYFFPSDRYAHMSNVGDDGIATGDLSTIGTGTTIDDTQTVTIAGAESLIVTLYYDTFTYDGYGYVSVYQSPFTISSSNDGSVSAATGNLSGKKRGTKSGRNTSYTTWNSVTYNVTGDTVKFHFYRSEPDYYRTYYGYYAVVSAPGGRTLTSGEYAAPTGTNAVFHGWSSTATTPGVGLPSSVEYADETAVKEWLAGDNTETKTLYAVWQQGYPITFTKDSNVSSIAVVDDSGTTVGTITSSGQSLNLYQGSTYTLKPTYTTSYTTSAIIKTTGAGTVNSHGVNADFVVGAGSATISVTSRQMLPMQNYSCSNLAVGVTDMVYDTRDNTSYMIGKLADNKCWMLDNLALDLVAKKSSLTNSNTNASTTTLNYLKNGGGTTSDKYATAAVANWASYDSYSAPLVNVTNKNVVPSDATSTAGGWKVGGYYNYCAASAGSYCYGNGTTAGTSSGNATEDICPKGWRMPTSGEFSALANAIYGSTSSTTDPTAYANYRAALHLPLSGSFNNGSPLYGSSGMWWASTRLGNNYMYAMRANTSDIRQYDFGYNYFGYSLRCIIGS